MVGYGWHGVGFLLVTCGCLEFPSTGDNTPSLADAAWPDAAWADATDPCADAIPAGCELFTCPGLDACYRQCGDVTSLAEAIIACDSADSKVVETQTRAEVECLPDHSTGRVWIGLAQDEGAAGVAQGWTWLSSGTAPEMHFWGDGEPDDLAPSTPEEDQEEQCAELAASIGGWADIPCAEDVPTTVICELLAP